MAHASKAHAVPAAHNAPTTVRKKADDRVSVLIDNCVRKKHRSMFFILGQNPEKRVATLHQLQRNKKGGTVEVLWCYQERALTGSLDPLRTNLMKKQHKKSMAGSSAGEDAAEESFRLFLEQAHIKKVYYKETESILGNTFGMCVLQDYKAVTPNVLARVMQTVEGGGIIIFLLNKLNDFKEIYTMVMDVHARYRSPRHKVVPRFNERLVLSLGDCDNFLFINEDMEVIPFTSRAERIEPSDRGKFDGGLLEDERELRSLQASSTENPKLHKLMAMARTLDQGKALNRLSTLIAEHNMRTTVAITAGRGRGKSAALGLAVALALADGYGVIYVTAPSSSNLQTFFQFLTKALDELGVKDYNVLKRKDQHNREVVEGINILKPHRQTVQYVSPEDAKGLKHAELLVIDEAAAIPLPIVRDMLGSFLVFMASTISGYEGTGRALSLKLINNLRQESQNPALVKSGGRQLVEIELDEPIRYARKDPIERWLNRLLCMDPTAINAKEVCSTVPALTSCETYYVNRDALFSYAPLCESFLQRVQWMSASSHYRNSPDDLQMLSDAPGHHLFVLCAKRKENQTLPDVVAMAQVAEEGQIARDELRAYQDKDQRPSGDMLPYAIAQQFQQPDFGKLSGIRVHRIAVHPNYERKGYGGRLLRTLHQYFKGAIVSENDNAENEQNTKMTLLVPLTQRPWTEKIHYIGTAFGITRGLHDFWKKSGYLPLYIRQTKHKSTGEHSCMMVQSLRTESDSGELSGTWVQQFNADFKQRFVHLLGSVFRHFPADLVLGLLGDSASIVTNAGRDRAGPKGVRGEDGKLRHDGVVQLTADALGYLNLTQHDLARLSAVARLVAEYSVALDLVPKFAQMYFSKQLRFLPNGRDGVLLDVLPAGVLISFGLQLKTMDEVLVSEPFNALGATQIKVGLTTALKAFNEYFIKLTAPPEDDTKTSVAPAVAVAPLASTKTAARSEKPSQGQPQKRKFSGDQDGGKKKKKQRQ